MLSSFADDQSETTVVKCKNPAVERGVFVLENIEYGGNADGSRYGGIDIESAVMRVDGIGAAVNSVVVIDVHRFAEGHRLGEIKVIEIIVNAQVVY